MKTKAKMLAHDKSLENLSDEDLIYELSRKVMAYEAKYGKLNAMPRREASESGSSSSLEM